MPFHWELPDEEDLYDGTYRRPAPDPGAPTLQEMIDRARRDSREGRTEELTCHSALTDHAFDAIIRELHRAPRWWERALRAVGRLIGRLARYTKG